MGKHSAPRTRRSVLRTIAVAAVIGATAAGVGTLYAAVEPVQGTAHPIVAATERDAAGVIEACWSEPKPNGEREPICGSLNLAPADAYGFTSLEQARKRDAAQAIADQLDTQWWTVEEDWTWQGMPMTVAAFNDELLDEWTAAGRPDPSGWLGSYAATREV